MSTEENKALVRRFYDEVTNGRKVAVLDELLAPNFEGFKVEAQITAKTARNSNKR
jgi:ketosteroid isomerase-like protein